MGLSNSAQSFQRYISHILKDIPNLYIYLDDILVFHDNEEDHIKTIKLVMDQLNKAGLTLALDKCYVFSWSGGKSDYFQASVPRV